MEIVVVIVDRAIKVLKVTVKESGKVIVVYVVTVVTMLTLILLAIAVIMTITFIPLTVVMMMTDEAVRHS